MEFNGFHGAIGHDLSFAGPLPLPAGQQPSFRSSDDRSVTKKKPRRGADPANQKRRCVSTACVACRRRKSKCDGAVPSCAACASVYNTECVYDPHSDHRRKGVYSQKIDSLKVGDSTLQILIEAILNASEDEVSSVVRKIRTCDSLDKVAEQLLQQQESDEEDVDDGLIEDNDINDDVVGLPVQGERELARKMGEMRLENGAVRFIGGTSHLVYAGDPHAEADSTVLFEDHMPSQNPITTWTRVTQDEELISHLMDMYFTFHYAYFTTLSRSLFWRDYQHGNRRAGSGTIYCSELLVNAMLALGCHFTDVPGAYGTPGDSRTKGDHFFAEAKRLIWEHDEAEKARLVTVQALGLMSVREAGCAREARGWFYSGMSFRMAQDIGLNLDNSGFKKEQRMSDEERDARRITFWGCFLFDKCWSNYLGRLPQIPKNTFNVSKIDVFPSEDGATWSHLTDGGFDASSSQPARTRAAALELSKLCEISSDLLLFFYHPHIARSTGKTHELKKLSDLHQRLEEWRKNLPREFDPKEGQLPNVILMHMFFHLQYIHLFRPFLKYSNPSSKTNSVSPLPSHVSPRRIVTTNAGAISKLMRLYKKSWGLRQICNIAVYLTHSACNVHLLNLPEKTARRDITHGVKHLEEIAEDWLCARRTLSILSVLSRKWKCDLPEDAAVVFERTDRKYDYMSTSEVPSPRSQMAASPAASEKSGVSRSQRDYSPSHHYLVPGGSPSQIHQQHPSIDDRMSTHASPHMIVGNQLSPHNGAIEAGNIGLNPETLPGMAGWPSTLPPTTTFPAASFGPVPPPIPEMKDGTRQVSPPIAPIHNVGMEREWFLDDSARWQHGFQGWDMGAGAGPVSQQQVFTFGDDQSDTSSRNGMRRPSDGQQYNMSFEGLDASMSGGGWVTGLD